MRQLREHGFFVVEGDEEGWYRMKFLVIDTDSITGVYFEAFVQWVTLNHLSFSTAYLSGKDPTNNERFYETLKRISPGADIVTYRALSIKNHADVLCGVAVGRIIEKIKCTANTDTATHEVYILSRDKLVASLARTALAEGLVPFVLEETVDASDGIGVVQLSMSTKEKPSSEPVYSSPIWYKRYLTEREKSIGLVCEEVPTEEHFQKPNFIPFPIEASKIHVGSGGGEINLEVWDFPRKGLYPQHVLIEYRPSPVSKWVIRSLKGMRRGNRQVVVDGRAIDSSQGDVPMQDGTSILLGRFSFRFSVDNHETFLRFESAEFICKQIETNLKKCVKRIPWHLVNSVGGYVHRKDPSRPTTIKVPLSSDLSNADFSVYGHIIRCLWNHFPEIKNCYKTGRAFSFAFQDLKDKRNLIAHPSSGGVSEEEKSKLIDFLFLTERELRRNPNDSTHVGLNRHAGQSNLRKSAQL